MRRRPNLPLFYLGVFSVGFGLASIHYGLCAVGLGLYLVYRSRP